MPRPYLPHGVIPAVLLPFDNMDLYVGRDQILVSLSEASGNIWSAKVSD